MFALIWQSALLLKLPLMQKKSNSYVRHCKAVTKCKKGQNFSSFTKNSVFFSAASCKKCHFWCRQKKIQSFLISDGFSCNFTHFFIPQTCHSETKFDCGSDKSTSVGYDQSSAPSGGYQAGHQPTGYDQAEPASTYGKSVWTRIRDQCYKNSQLFFSSNCKVQFYT